MTCIMRNYNQSYSKLKGKNKIKHFFSKNVYGQSLGVGGIGELQFSFTV